MNDRQCDATKVLLTLKKSFAAHQTYCYYKTNETIIYITAAKRLNQFVPLLIITMLITATVPVGMFPSAETGCSQYALA